MAKTVLSLKQAIFNFFGKEVKMAMNWSKNEETIRGHLTRAGVEFSERDFRAFLRYKETGILPEEYKDLAATEQAQELPLAETQVLAEEQGNEVFGYQESASSEEEFVQNPAPTSEPYPSAETGTEQSLDDIFSTESTDEDQPTPPPPTSVVEVDENLQMLEDLVLMQFGAHIEFDHQVNLKELIRLLARFGTPISKPQTLIEFWEGYQLLSGEKSASPVIELVRTYSVNADGVRWKLAKKHLHLHFDYFMSGAWLKDENIGLLPIEMIFFIRFVFGSQMFTIERIAKLKAIYRVDPLMIESLALSKDNAITAINKISDVYYQMEDQL